MQSYTLLSREPWINRVAICNTSTVVLSLETTHQLFNYNSVF